MNLKKIFENDVMEFYCHPDLHDIITEPVPAFKKMPDWYRTLSPHVPEDDGPKRDVWGAQSMTAKKCMPMLDCMSLGFIITMPAGIHVKSNIDCSQVVVTNPSGLNVAEYHDIDQLGGPKAPGCPAPPLKFLNYWVIKTKPGYSTLFTPPTNHFNPNFTCLSGLVDTDRYPKEVNFPAIWHTPNFDDYIPGGTPLVQVIPIRRKDISRKPNIRKMDKKEFADIERLNKKQKLFRNYYTNELREPRK